MFTTLQLRLCCLSAMAPALTEAASQAPTFKLPFTPPAAAQSSIVVVDRLRLRTSCGQPDDQGASGDLLQNKGAISSDENPFLTSDDYDLEDIVLDPELGSKLSVFDLERGSRIAGEEAELIADNPWKQLACFESRQHCSFLRTMSSGINNKNLSAMGISKTSVNLQLTADRSDKISSVMQHPPNNVYAELDALAKYSEGQESEITKGTLVKDRLQETCTRQINLERRTERLIRRIQKLQARQIEMHVGGQLAAFVEYQQKSLNLPSKKESGCRT